MIMNLDVDTDWLEEIFYSHFEELTEESQKEILKKLEILFVKSKGWKIHGK